MKRPNVMTWIRLLGIPSLLLVGCGATDTSAADKQQTAGNYAEIKTIVLDVLHSKEGISTLQDTMGTSDFKSKLTVSPNDVRTAVEKLLQQGQNKSFFASQMNDPTFALVLVNAAKPQLLSMQKQLVKDPTYQRDLAALLHSSYFAKLQLDALRSPDYREAIQTIMTDALQQPTFQQLFKQSMQKAMKESSGKKQDTSKSQGDSKEPSDSDSEQEGGE
nr:hypothetical protein [Bacilli bacterium]